MNTISHHLYSINRVPVLSKGKVSTFDGQIKQSTSTVSFKEKDNRSQEEQELIQLCKKVKQLEMGHLPFTKQMYPLLVGNKFKNQVIDEILEAFNIERSLSMKGSPCPSMKIEGILH